MNVCPTCDSRYADDVRVCPKDGTVLEPEDAGDPHIGQLLDGKYRLDVRIGQGGMGTIYQGVHLMLGKPVAVKMIRPEFVTSPEVVRRFQREARAASTLIHPNIATAYDLGRSPDGTLYIAMEFVDGITLKQLIRASRFLPPERIVPLLRQVTNALSLAHGQQIVHRDLKPHNIMVATDRVGRDVAKLLDFGIAKTFTEATQLTATGFLIGTPQYMSPEQINGETIDARSDLYALGVILYEMLIGEVPFDAPATPAVLIKHLQSTPEPPSLRRPDIAVVPALEAIAMRCLEKRPDDRYQSADELAAALDAAPTAVAAAPIPPAPIVVTPPPPIDVTPPPAPVEQSLDTVPTPPGDLLAPVMPVPAPASIEPVRHEPEAPPVEPELNQTVEPESTPEPEQTPEPQPRNPLWMVSAVLTIIALGAYVFLPPGKEPSVQMLVKVHAASVARQTGEIIAKRLKSAGVNSLVSATRPDQLTVDVAGSRDLGAIKELVTSMGNLELRLVEAGPSTDQTVVLQPYSGQIPPAMDLLSAVAGAAGIPMVYLVRHEPVVTNTDIVSAEATLDSNNAPAISFSMSAAGASRLYLATLSNAGRLMAIVFNGRIVSAPAISEPIKDRGQITGSFTQQEVNDLALMLNVGALPAAVSILEEHDSEIESATNWRALVALAAAMVLAVISGLLYFRPTRRGLA